MNRADQESPIPSLTDNERLDFERVVLDAVAMGWLPPDQRLAAIPDRSTVLVHTVGSGDRRERTYLRTRRWIFELLHDLADGYWNGASTADEEVMQHAPRRA